MNAYLDNVAVWFQSLGMHPVLGAFVAGALFAFLFGLRRPRKPAETEAGATIAPPPAAAPGAMMAGGSTTATVTVNRQQVRVPAETIEHLRAGNKIEAIKALRAATGLDLKQAKDIVDAMAELPSMK